MLRIVLGLIAFAILAFVVSVLSTSGHFWASGGSRFGLLLVYQRDPEFTSTRNGVAFPQTFYGGPHGRFRTATRAWVFGPLVYLKATPIQDWPRESSAQWRKRMRLPAKR